MRKSTARRWLALALVGFLLLPLSACGPTPDRAAYQGNDVGKELAEIKEAGVGSVVTFGKYEQDADPSNGKENIEWFVLDKQEDRALLVSCYCLDSQPYHEECVDVTWETCSLRQWLNETFLSEAFVTSEQEQIMSVTLENPDNAYFETPGGNDTIDQVFLLSHDEWERYFSIRFIGLTPDGESTAYAKEQGINDGHGDEEYAWWWLRTPGRDNTRAAFIMSDGDCLVSGEDEWLNGEVETKRNVDCREGGVRPAIYVKL